MNCRGLAKRVMSPSSATSVAAATNVRPRSACSAFTTGVSDQIRKRGFDVGFKTIPPSRRRLDGRDAIFQHDVMRCVFERQSGKPAPVHQGPGRPVIMTAMAQQKAGELLARLPQHAHRRQSRAHQIADRLMGWVWNPHWRQFIRSVQFGQVNRVASVGFDPIAGLARNQRRGDYDAFVPSFAQLALNVVTARAGLIAKSKAPAMTRQLRRQSPQRRRRVRDLAKLAQPPLARLGKRHRVVSCAHPGRRR